MKMKPVLQSKIREEQKLLRENKKDIFELDHQKITVVKKTKTELWLKYTGKLLRCIFTVVLFLLSTIGLFALIYPNARFALWSEITLGVQQLLNFFH